MDISFPRATLRWAEDKRDRVFELVDEGIEKIPKEVHEHAGPFLDILRSIRRKIYPQRRSPDELTSLEKKAIAAGIFYGLSYKYGFEEALDKDNWTPWPDEFNMTNCYSQATANYVVAGAAGLNPTLVEFVGLQKTGDTLRAGHSLVVVDVGERGKPEFWTIDQSLRMYGPVKIGEITMEVENLAATQERTHRKDFRREVHGFLVSIANNEERIARHTEELRSNPEMVLYSGQRIGAPTIDSWQSEEPTHVPWYLKFTPDYTEKTRGDIVSRVALARPGIKSRGLEYRITLGNDNNIQDERFLGYYCKGNVWADFVSPIPLVDIPFEKLKELVKGLKDISLKDRPRFELDLMKESSQPSERQRNRINAARDSFARVTESEYGDIVLAMVAAEALYQQDKGEKEPYLKPTERIEAIKKLRGESPLIEYYARAAKLKGKVGKTRRLFERRPELLDRFILLRPNQREDHRTRAFLELENEEERFDFILEHRPNYFDDAIDRLVFYNRRIKGREDVVLDTARETFGANYDAALFGAYVRIFAEFLGHAAVTYSELSLEKYKKKIVKKLTSKH